MTVESTPLRRTTLALVAASVLAMALLTLRIVWSGLPHFGFLAWNLFLAWLPFVFALAMRHLDRVKAHGCWLVALGLPWLALLPNAPYIITDFIHLPRARRQFTPLWLDAAMISTFALTGLVLGMVALLLVHRIVSRRLGAGWGWAMSGTVLALSTVGIYIGRVHRFNSWDILMNPMPLLRLVWTRISDPLGHPDLLVALGLGTIGLVVAYLLTWAVARRTTAVSGG